MSVRDFTTGLSSEDGHLTAGVPAVLAGIGIIALGIGAAGDWGWLALIGGIGGGLALMAYAVAEHMVVDYNVFGRLEALEGSKPSTEEPAATATTEG